jgi:hypothetical protein
VKKPYKKPVVRSKRRASKEDYEVRECPVREAKKLVVAHHYAKGSSMMGWSHCLVKKSTGEVVGAAIWLPPTKVAAQSVAKWRAGRLLEPYVRAGGRIPANVAAAAAYEAEDWRSVLSLSRLVVKPGEPQNATGLLLGRAIRLVQPRWRTLVTYADSRQGHSGTIYKATNWTRIGERKGDPVWLDKAGRQVSRKAGPRSRTSAEMRALGYERQAPLPKVKFVFPRG